MRPRALLLGKVWGPYSEVEDASLDSYIHFVRRRLLAVGARALGARLTVGSAPGGGAAFCTEFPLG